MFIQSIYNYSLHGSLTPHLFTPCLACMKSKQASVVWFFVVQIDFYLNFDIIYLEVFQVGFELGSFNF